MSLVARQRVIRFLIFHVRLMQGDVFRIFVLYVLYTLYIKAAKYGAYQSSRSGFFFFFIKVYIRQGECYLYIDMSKI
jgi:hypothetical protein